jgi:dTDP-4-dehydrorhamnose reductase
LELDAVALRFPTWTRDVAEALRFVLERGVSGVVHYSSLREGTRYSWTREVAEVLGASADHLTPSAGVVPRGARRPLNSQLDPAYIREMGFDRFTDFKDAVRRVLSELGVAGRATCPGEA